MASPLYAGRAHRLSTLIFGFSGVGPEFCLRRGGKKMVPFEEKNGGETVSDGGGKGERRRLFLISCFCLLEGRRRSGRFAPSPWGKEGGGGEKEGHKLLFFFQKVDEGGGLLLPLFPPGGRGVKLTSPGESGRTNGYMAPLSSPFLLAVRPIPSPFPSCRLQSFLPRPSLALGNADPVPEQQ